MLGPHSIGHVIGQSWKATGAPHFSALALSFAGNFSSTDEACFLQLQLRQHNDYETTRDSEALILELRN
jgi:hypothetical protein